MPNSDKLIGAFRDKGTLSGSSLTHHGNESIVWSVKLVLRLRRCNVMDVLTYVHGHRGIPLGQHLQMSRSAD
jgi:hypothetical protein